MASATRDNKSFLEKLSVYFENYPGRCCDVSFVVGSGDEKEVIQTSQIIQEIVCPEFMKLFDEKWGQAVDLANKKVSGTNGIPLPDVDPNAFKIFLKLLVLDDISADFLNKFNIPSKDLLNVIGLCEKYKMPKIQENLEKVAQNTYFGSTFRIFAKTDEFIALTKSNLNTILRNDNLDASETEIFQALIRWAEKRCSERGIQNTGENIREVLADSLYRIRFPTMSSKEFISNLPLKSVLTQAEQLELISYIISKEQLSTTPETVLAFDKTERVRNMSLQLLTGIEIVNNPPFVCDGKNDYCLEFKVNQAIQVCSVGFLGPIDSDSLYEVTVEIIHFNGSTGSDHSMGEVEKKVFAKKDEIFYVSFDEPITINATYNIDDFYGKYYQMKCSLKGPNTTIPHLPNLFKKIRTDTDEGIGFNCRILDTPLAELRFKKQCDPYVFCPCLFDTNFDFSNEYESDEA